MSELAEVRERGPQLGQTERPKRLAENVAEQLLNYITSQDLEPGTPLATQATMLEDLEVGQASLREALRFLEVLGFIELRAGRNGGPVVGDPSGKNFARMSSMYFHALGVKLRDILDARVVLEPAMVRNIADRGLDDAGRRRVQGFSSSGPDSAAVEGADADHNFHWSIAELSNNAVLKLTAQAMRHIYGGLAEELEPSSKEGQKISTMHTEIADALLEGDGERAERLMAEHLEHVRAVYEKQFPQLLEARIPWP
jgi:GntR family transcriptional regulator, transcriptional repressor for pyruvate dehydrogenase complex